MYSKPVELLNAPSSRIKLSTHLLAQHYRQNRLPNHSVCNRNGSPRAWHPATAKASNTEQPHRNDGLPQPKATAVSIAQLEKQVLGSTSKLSERDVGRLCSLLVRTLQKLERQQVKARVQRRRALWKPPPTPEAAATATSSRTISSSTPAHDARIAIRQEGGAGSDSMQHAKRFAIRILDHLLQHSVPFNTYKDPVSSSHVVQALGAVNYSPVPMTALALMEANLASKLPTMPTSCLARLIWGWSKLAYKPADSTLMAIKHECMSRSSDIGYETSVTLLQGLAALQCSIHPSVPYEIARNLKPYIACLTPAQLAILLHSLAQLGYQPDASWMSDFTQRSSSHIPGFTMKDAALISSALLSLRYVPPKWWVDKYLKYTEQAMWLDQDVSIEDTSETASSLARLNIAIPGSWLHHAMTIIRGLPPPLPQQQAKIAGPKHLIACAKAEAKAIRDGLQAQQQQQQEGEVRLKRKLPETVVHLDQIQHSGELGSSPDRQQTQGKAAGTQHTPAAADTKLQDAMKSVEAEPFGSTDSQVPIGVPDTLLPTAELEAKATFSAGGSSSPGSTDQAHDTSSKQPSISLQRRKVEPKLHLTPCQAAQAVYIIAKGREHPALKRHIKWAAGLLKQLLADLPAVMNNSWSAMSDNRSYQSDTTKSTATDITHQQTGDYASQVELAKTQASMLQMQSDISGGHSSNHTLEKQQAYEPVGVVLQRLIDILYACAELRHMPPPHTLQQLLHHMLPLLPSSTPAQATTIMVCLAVLRAPPDHQWAQHFFACLHDRIEAYSVQELANALTAAAYLNLQPGETLFTKVDQEMPKYNLVQLAMLVRKLDEAPVTKQVAWLAGILNTARAHMSGRP